MEQQIQVVDAVHRIHKYQLEVNLQKHFENDCARVQTYRGIGTNNNSRRKENNLLEEYTTDLKQQNRLKVLTTRSDGLNEYKKISVVKAIMQHI